MPFPPLHSRSRRTLAVLAALAGALAGCESVRPEAAPPALPRSAEAAPQAARIDESPATISFRLVGPSVTAARLHEILHFGRPRLIRFRNWAGAPSVSEANSGFARGRRGAD